MKRCPHNDVRFCPLYLAAHTASGGCDDGRLGEGGCAVTRGLSYANERKRLEVAEFHLVARAEFDERQEARRQQAARNMRLCGLRA